MVVVLAEVLNQSGDAIVLYACPPCPSAHFVSVASAVFLFVLEGLEVLHAVLYEPAHCYISIMRRGTQR